MLRQFDSFAYMLALLSTVPLLYATLASIDGALEEGMSKTLLYLGATALWANLITSLVYYRRRLKQLAPEEM